MTMNDQRHDSPWFRPGKWRVSPWNFQPELEACREFAVGRRAFVSDGTIRAICNSEPGAVVSNAQMVEIARTLEEMGVAEIRLATGGNEIANEVGQAIMAEGLGVPRCGGIKIEPELAPALIGENRRAGVQRIELEDGPLHPKPGFHYPTTHATWRAYHCSNIRPELRMNNAGYCNPAADC